MTQNTSKDLCKIYFVRHGESEGNVLGIIQGHADFPLSARGQQQAVQLGQALQSVDFAAVFSSDLIRARDTAAAVAIKRQLVVKTTQLLRERNFGTFERSANVESQRELRDLLHQYELLDASQRHTHKLAADIESDAELVSRVLLFLREVAVAYQNQSVLMVSHSGIMRVLLVHLGYLSYGDLATTKVANTSYIVLESDGVDFFVKETVGITRFSQEP